MESVGHIYIIEATPTGMYIYIHTYTLSLHTAQLLVKAGVCYFHDLINDYYTIEHPLTQRPGHFAGPKPSFGPGPRVSFGDGG